jgi:hypothetical protein
MEADWNRVHIVQADGHPKYGDQNTDGSRSIRNHFDDWRTAGATARAMLVAAAAQTWDVPPAECKADNHRVVHDPTGRVLGYGELAATAATLTVPTDVPFKLRARWRYIGTALRGVDNHAIATGEAVFGSDVRVLGMLHASVERCPVLGGRVSTYAAAATLQTPGVARSLAQPKNANLNSLSASPCTATSRRGTARSSRVTSTTTRSFAWPRRRRRSTSTSSRARGRRAASENRACRLWRRPSPMPCSRSPASPCASCRSGWRSR